MLIILDDLVAICKEYQSRIFKLEGDKWDLERGVKIRILEVPWDATSVLLLLIVLFSLLHNYPPYMFILHMYTNFIPKHENYWTRLLD